MEDQKPEVAEDTLAPNNEIPEEAGPRVMLKMMRAQEIPFFDKQVEDLKKLPAKDQLEFLYRLLMQSNSMLTQLWEIEQIRSARMRQQQGQPAPKIIIPRMN